jgi:nicotinamide-nucleotide amidase
MLEDVSPDNRLDGLGQVSVLGRLAATVGDLLRQHGETLALAESCTGGLVAAVMTSVAGSSDYLWGGATVYSAAAKRTMLDLEDSLLAQHGTVSRETTGALAAAVRALADATYGLGVTGWAGPEGGTEADPVGTVYVAIDSARGSETRRFCFEGDRTEVREQAVRAALGWLRDELLEADRPAEETDQ